MSLVFVKLYIHVFVYPYKMDVLTLLALGVIAVQGVQDSNPGLATSISEIGYLLLSSRDMTEQRKC